MAEWTEVQWQIFRQAFEHEIDDARLAHKVIPATDVGGSARSVPRDQFDYETGIVDDVTPVALEECEEIFRLTRAQAEDDEDLSSAQVTVRRAAQSLARQDDVRVFRTAIRDPIANNAIPKSKAYQDVFEVSRPTARDVLDGDGMVAKTAAAVAALDLDGYRSGYVLLAGMLVYELLYTRGAGAADLPVVAVRGPVSYTHLTLPTKA